jgi:SAM-dependent methyltransferase
MHLVPTYFQTPNEPAAYDFLQIDQFLRTGTAAAALSAGLRLGVVDRLVAGPADYGSLPVTDSSGKALLLELLATNNVVVINQPQVRLSEAFRAILPFRDLLEAKLAFAADAAADVGTLLPELVDDLPAFMAKSRTFRLFRYDLCLDPTPENVAHTRAWVRFTTALTRYEAQAFLDMADLTGLRRMMDLGGNSGEFVRQLCRRHPGLQATVFDLPVVAAIGREHVAGAAEAARITFCAGDMRRDDLPRGFDLVTFKSVLHDWPDADAHRLLAKAKEAVRPGGTLAIFERGPLIVPAGGLPYSMLPNLVFFRFFRPAGFYEQALRALGMTDVRVSRIRLEMDFNLVTAIRAS